MTTGEYAMTIPLGTGLSIELTIDTEAGQAWGSVMDEHYGEVVSAEEFLGLADAILGTYFMEPTVPALRGEPVRHYKVMRGWALSGWRSTIGMRVRANWTPSEEVLSEYAA